MFDAPPHCRNLQPVLGKNPWPLALLLVLQVIVPLLVLQLLLQTLLPNSGPFQPSLGRNLTLKANLHPFQASDIVGDLPQ